MKLGFISQLRVLLQHPSASFELGLELAIFEILELKRPWPSKSFLLPTDNHSSSLNYELKRLEVFFSWFNEKNEQVSLGQIPSFHEYPLQ